MPGTEHIASLEEDESLSRLVQEIRVMEQCLGSEKKKLPCEIDTFQTHSKSLVLKINTKRGNNNERTSLSHY